jgi:D-alanyl-D-alanine carboxypeptidase (penicillin-binding protein 5/6)
MGGSQVLLDVNERQTVDMLLRCMIVGSANDAAVALAEAMYGSEALCVDAMNRRAEALGMTDTHFENCTGLPAAGQHTTARDVAVMSRQVFAHPHYFDHSALWMEDIDHGDGRMTQLVNTNKLLRLCDGCDGGKTGSTKEAGYCVTATAKRGDMRLVAVVLGAESGKERFAIAREMLEYGFANYRRYPVAVRGTRVRGRLPVTGGMAEGVALVLDGELTLLIPRGDEQRITLEPALPESLPAPVEMGLQVGHVRVLVDGRETAQIPVATAEDVAAKASGLPRIIDRWPGV